jgi:hypothetical protein
MGKDNPFEYIDDIDIKMVEGSKKPIDGSGISVWTQAEITPKKAGVY